MFGLAKIMTVMFKAIVLLKVLLILFRLWIFRINDFSFVGS